MTQAEAQIAILKELATAIQQLGSVPSGHLYARSCMSFMSAETFQMFIGALVRTGLVTEKNHLFTWVGPKPATDAKEKS